MTAYSNIDSSHHEASSDPIDNSDEELFGSSYRQHNTVATVPLPIPRLASAQASEESEEEHGTIATIPLPRPTQQDSINAGRMTQPTQILPQSPYHNYHNYQYNERNNTSPLRPHVQVTASSPVAGTPNARQPYAGFVGNRTNPMAPAGTSFRQPIHPHTRVQKPLRIDDDDGPTYKGGSSDDDDVRARGSNIKTTQFQRTAYVPESPAKPAAPVGAFSSLVREFEHKNGTKRAGDDMAYAYGNVSKKSRQTAPSRARPVQNQTASEADMDIDDILSANDRRKVREMMEVVSGASVRLCHQTLIAKKGHFDDAVDHLLDQQDKVNSQASKVTIVDIISDDEDELHTTPAVQKTKPVIKTTKQQAKVPSKSIADKWGSTQQPKKDVGHLAAFSPSHESKPRKRLVRGRKDRSSPDFPDLDEEKEPIGRRAKIANTVVFDDSDHDSNATQEVEKVHNLSFQERVLKFFNTCASADLADTANIKPSLAEHFISQQPFRSLAAVEKVDDPSRPPAKAKRAPVGEKIAEKVSVMLGAYEAVDYLVRKCEAIAEPLAKEIKKWGGNNTGNGEIDKTSMQHSPSHDSGIGTPTDDEHPRVPAKDYITQPKIMNSDYQLKDYQVVGMNWLNLLYQRKLSCILADDMGLGKTYQIIAFLSHLFETGKKGPHLIVVPAATLENWLMEFQRFSPRLKVEPYYATAPGARAELRFQMEHARDEINVIVTTYHVAKAKEDAPWLREFGFDCTIFDEGHVLKNAESQVSKKLSRIDGEFRVLLTGTPLQNNLKELMSLLGFMMPDLFYEKSEQLQAIFEHSVKTMDEDNHGALLSTQRIIRARSILTPFILRRKKDQVAQNLPPKDRKVVYCDLSPEQREIYQFWYNKALSIRERRERGEDCGKETTHILMKLRQAAIHPWLFRRHYKDAMLPKIAKTCLRDEQWAQSQPELIVIELEAYSDMEVHTLCAKNAVLNKYALKNKEWLASGKIAKMLELLRSYIAEGSRTLIFSQFVMVLDILEVVLDHEMMRYFRLDGSTRVDQRQDLINTFSEDGNDTPVFLLSTKAGGAGINLAAANKVIILDSGFNPQDDIQAENRAHRIGQTKPVEVVRLVSRDTVEEAIYKMGLTKVELDQRVAGGASGTATPPGEVEESAAGQELKMTQQEAQGLQIVENLFFDNLEAEDAYQAVKAALPNQQSVDPSVAQDMAKIGDMSIPSDEKKTIVDDDSDDGNDMKVLTHEDATLVNRPKRIARNAGVKATSQSSQKSTSSRSSRTRSQK